MTFPGHDAWKTSLIATSVSPVWFLVPGLSGADPVNGYRPVPKAGRGHCIKVSSMVIVWPAKSQRMRLCQCLGLMIADQAFQACRQAYWSRPLPEGSERVLVSIADDRPDHQQTIWTLPVGNKMVLPVINTTISETSEETSNILLPCDQEPCVARDYGGRVSVWDFAEMTLSGESGTAERENRKVREVVQTRDQNGNIILPVV